MIDYKALFKKKIVQKEDIFNTEDDFGAEIKSHSRKFKITLSQFRLPGKLQDLSKPAVALVSAGATFIVCVVGSIIIHTVAFNAYNSNKDGYLITVREQAESQNMSVKEYKDALGLPGSMRGDTVAAVASMYMPAGKYFEMNHGIAFDMAIEAMGLSEDKRVNADMPYGELEKIIRESEKAKAESANKSEENK